MCSCVLVLFVAWVVIGVGCVCVLLLLLCVVCELVVSFACGRYVAVCVGVFVIGCVFACLI